MTPLFACGTFGQYPIVSYSWAAVVDPCRAQSNQPIQILKEARDAVQALHVDSATITTGSIDGHVRTYDLRKGELRSDFIGRRPILPLSLFRQSQALQSL